MSWEAPNTHSEYLETRFVATGAAVGLTATQLLVLSTAFGAIAGGVTVGTQSAQAGQSAGGGTTGTTGSQAGKQPDPSKPVKKNVVTNKPKPVLAEGAAQPTVTGPAIPQDLGPITQAPVTNPQTGQVSTLNPQTLQLEPLTGTVEAGKASRGETLAEGLGGVRRAAGAVPPSGPSTQQRSGPAPSRPISRAERQRRADNLRQVTESLGAPQGIQVSSPAFSQFGTPISMTPEQLIAGLLGPTPSFPPGQGRVGQGSFEPTGALR